MKRNLFKSPTRDCVLSSFEKFNVGIQSFQQFVWCANVGGIGVWSESGLLRGTQEKWFPVGGAYVTQRDNIVLITQTM